MTGKTFRGQIYLTILLLLGASGLTLWGGVQLSTYADASRAIIPVYIAVAAAWLTFCLQRRIAYIVALRGLWERVVDVVQEANHYTYLSDRSEAEFRQLLRKLCCRIDEVRGVFRNVGEQYRAPTLQAKTLVRAVKHSGSSERLAEAIHGQVEDVGIVGVYPFESLKQMHTVVNQLGFGATATPSRAHIARDAIAILWRILRSELLKELDRDYPEFPDTPYEPGPRGPIVQRLVALADRMRNSG